MASKRVEDAQFDLASYPDYGENDDDDDTSLNSENEEILHNVADSLENRIKQNALNHRHHLDLISIFRKLTDLENLRIARFRMAESLPLRPEMWIDWLDDEIDICTNVDEKRKVLEIFEKAVKDYLDVDLWLKYLVFLGDIYSPENPADLIEVRRIYEQAVALAGLHTMKGSVLWCCYLSFEKKVLSSMKFQDDPELYLKQLENIGNVYKRMLSVPLIDLGVLYDECKEWLAGLGQFKNKVIDPVEIGKIYRTTEKKLQKVKHTEETLVVQKENTLLHYKKYLNYEKSEQGSPTRVIYVYERMISDYPREEWLWLDYINYRCNVLRERETVVDTVERAVKSCPNGIRLHQCLLQNLEKYDRPHEQIKATFERGLACEFLQPKKYLDLWYTYLEYMRRRYDACDISEEERTQRRDELRADFKRAVDFLYKKDGDREYSVQLFWARVEGNRFKDMEKFRSLMKEIFADYDMRTADMWLEYLNIERANGDKRSLRNALHQALQHTHDCPYKIAQYWINYEREEGSIASMDDCNVKIERRLKEFREEQEREEKLNQGKKDTHNKNKGSGSKKNNKNERQNNTNDNRGGKRKHESHAKNEKSPEKKSKQEENKRHLPAQQGGTGKDGVPEAKFSSKSSCTVFVGNLASNVTEGSIRNMFSPCGKVVNITLVKDTSGRNKNYCYVEFEKPSEAGEGLKKDRTLLKGRTMFVSKFNPRNDSRDKGFKYSSELEKNKLFIRGLDPAVTVSQLEDIYRNYGELKDVRIITFRSGESKGLAYVEFNDESSAAHALRETNGITLGNNKITVAFSNPPKKKENLPQAGPAPKASAHKASAPKASAPKASAPKAPAPRKTGRKLLAFVPRAVQMKVNTASESLARLSLDSPQPAEQTETQNGAEEPKKSPQPKKQPQNLTNNDFRKMFE